MYALVRGTKNMSTKKLLLSGLFGLMLCSALVQASKRAMVKEGASGSCDVEEILASESTEIVAATKQLFAALFPAFKSPCVEAYAAAPQITQLEVYLSH